MALTPGTRLGVYEITAHIGEGGMGQVYRARDTTLHRDVALKILPDAFATDKDRLARFTREAQTLAALNHPHIAHLHGLEDFAGLRALVMELVEGDDLSQRLVRGAIPVGDAIAIARQIAEALEAAHEQGIIHRDLKPANIKVRDDGTVKVLDFGLAKGVDAAGAAPMNVTQSPTITSPALTEAGVILGTAAYMSPEQAKGRAADRRSDVWAFGAVVYEMLTGQRPFKGEDVSETLAFILTREPDWTLLPADTPRVVERLLHRCLEKNPKRRLQAIAEARIQMDDLSSGAIAEGVQSRPVEAISSWRRVLPLASVGLLAAMAAAAGAWMAVRVPATSLRVTRFSVALPSSLSLATSINDRDVALSADGATLAYTAGSQSQLMIHALDQLEAQPLAGVANARAPVFSPDGRWIAFFNQLDETPGAGPLREGTLTKVSIAGGAPITLCRVTGGSRGASWAPDNTIVFATNDDTTGLLRVSAAAGEPTPLTTPDQSKGERDHLHPSVLPGGRGVVFSILYSGSPSRVAVLDLDTGGYKTLVREGSQAVYVESGHLVYVAARSLWAVRFNLATLEVVGDPLPIAEQVMTPAAANFSVSLSGALVYVRDTAASRGERSLVWVSRRGEQTPIAAPPRIYNYPRLSPDSTRVALRINDPEPGLWSWDFGPARFTQLAPDGGLSLVWSRDGLSFFFSRQHQRAEWITSRRRSNGIGADEPVLSSREYHMPLAISPDGSRLVYHAIPKPEADYDLMVLRLNGPSQPEPLVQTPADERNAEISPDGRWLAYESSTTRRSQIYVRPFPNVGDGEYQVSTNGGRTPVWAPNGRELYFTNDSSLMSAAIQTTPAFRAGNPERLFEDRSLLLDARTFTIGGHRTYDVAKDGRFLVMKFSAPDGRRAAEPSVVVVQNWVEELKRLLPAP